MSEQILQFKPRKLDRSPRLDTILMVEKEIYKHRSNKTVTQIWRLLPKKVMWTTFITILDYLEYSGKIIIEKDKTLTWLWDPDKVARLRKNGLVIA